MRFSRRDFVRTAAASAVLAGAAKGIAFAQDDEPRPIPRRKFERIDLEVPIMSVGTISTTDPAVLWRGLEWGMNFVHTSPGYSGGRAIRTVAEAIKVRREDFILGLKTGMDEGSVAECLEILGTDHLDIAFYPCEDPEGPKHDEMLRRIERLKEQKMTRFCGLTSHGSVPDVMGAGVEAGWWDVLMPAYSPGNAEQIDPIMEEAAEKGIGGMVMKSLNGVGDDQVETVWANMLAKKHWTTVCKPCGDEGMVDRMARLALTWEDYVDEAAGQAIAQAARGRVCTFCGQCSSVCPAGLQPHSIFRYEMYAAQYGWRDMGRAAYASLPAGCDATACTECGVCLSGCRGGLDIPTRLREAHRVLA